jgi:hypothetical protein
MYVTALYAMITLLYTAHCHTIASSFGLITVLERQDVVGVLGTQGETTVRGWETNPISIF